MEILKIIAISLAVLALHGCSTEKFDRNVPRGTIVTSPSSFTDEAYVWEGFMFPTNRTTWR
jgi:hypothetical protein